MVEQLLNHIRRHEVCKTTDKILLAVSGGVDSMVMLHLFREAGFAIGVAHCNFQLRGEASLADEKLVSSICSQNDIPCYIQRFDTEVYAQEKNLSIQMAARELRYSFFNRILVDHGYHFISTAHHINDTIETILLNLIKGTGMDGIGGIPMKKNNIIRPLLFFSKQNLIDYANDNQLKWREDSSNTSEDYQRNFVRHNIIPAFKTINPGFEKTFQATLERLKGGIHFAKNYIKQFKNEALEHKGDNITIDKNKLMMHSYPAVLLWELMKDKGFNYDQCAAIINAQHPGKKISSFLYELFVDRERYILARKGSSLGDEIIINDEKMFSVSNGGYSLVQEVQNKKNFTLSKASNIAQLDFGKITYPLTWRKWRAGDSFVPLGMHRSKKLSDFLIDLKLSMIEKNKITIIESAGTIVWVVGLRIHEQYKVTEQTDHILTLGLKPEQS